MPDMREQIKAISRANDFIAPKGLEWVCGVCGRHEEDRTRIGDESCFLNSILCRRRLVVGPDGIEWDAVGAQTSNG